MIGYLTLYLFVIQNIYKEGGRAFWVHNTGPIGCLPMNQFYTTKPPPLDLDQHSCVKAQNQMAVEFNRKLKDRIIKLRAQLTEAALTYVDVYTAKYILISRAQTSGKLLQCHEGSDSIWFLPIF